MFVSMCVCVCVCVYTIHVLFNFGLNLSIKFISFISSSELSLVLYIGIILNLSRLHWYRYFDTFNFLYFSILILLQCIDVPCCPWIYFFTFAAFNYVD